MPETPFENHAVLLIRRLVHWDYYDGAISGLGQILVPDFEFLFWTVDERFMENSADERLFVVYSIPPGSIDRSLDSTGNIDPEKLRRLQIPIPSDWEFGDSEKTKDTRWQHDLETFGMPQHIFLMSNEESVKQHWTVGCEGWPSGRPSFSSLKIR